MVRVLGRAATFKVWPDQMKVQYDGRDRIMREAKIISVVLNLITRVGLSLLVLLSHH